MLILLAGQLLDRRSLPPVEQIITILVCFVVATTIHEFAHAITAWRLGDDTAQRQGRITLDPSQHFEPFGFFGMIMISLGYNFIGWGKPVPVNPARIRRTRYIDGKRGMALVALAGPVSNVLQAGVAAIVLRVMGHDQFDLGNLLYLDSNRGTVGFFLGWYFWINVLLASFNMIPIPPLDGHKILVGLLPNFWYPVLAPLERYGFVILFLIFFIGNRTSSSITGDLFGPIRNALVTRLL
jgi:Zn-dependent protease